ncbi:MAG: alpha/beta hydrolase [Acidobacteria bacterium]|nr:alpha/beta hydrolase [Acidobacteriota bacterium]
MLAARRNNVTLHGHGETTMMLVHGFGCDQNMWRLVAPAFAGRFRVLLFDYTGCGQSDIAQYDPVRYSSLEGYAQDVLDIADELDIKRMVFVGHSVSAMIGILAANRQPERFGHLILVGPSPCYLNDDAYHGGFTRMQLEDLLDVLDSNHLGWSQAMAPVIMGNPERPDLGEELATSFCRMRPDIASRFARVTFLSDHRQDLSQVSLPSLILQCSQDPIAPEAVGEYINRMIPGSQLVQMAATGHCPNLSAPRETIAAIQHYLESHVIT